MAIEQFEEMRRRDLEMEAWFLNFMTTSLMSISAFPEAFDVFQLRAEHQEPISTALWDHVLSTAAQSSIYPLVHFVWRRAVATKFINPSSGTCTDVLATAARHGDFRLATDVMRILGERSSAILPHHYESLFEAYLKANDLSTALSVLSIMASTPTPPTEGGVSALYQYLLQKPDLPTRALNDLREIRQEGKPVPIAAINAILNALGQFNALDEALDTYDNLHTLVPSGPTTATFNALFRACKAAKDKDRAMFLASEMRARNIAPDWLTYDRLILVCTEAKNAQDVHDAYKYWTEMCTKGWYPRQGTVVALVKALVATRDMAVWRVLQENAKKGLDSMALRRWVNENWPRERGDAGGPGEEVLEQEVEGKEEGAAEVQAGDEGTVEGDALVKRKASSLRGRGGKWTSKEELDEWNRIA